MVFFVCTVQGIRLCSYQPVTSDVTLATVTNCKYYFFEAPVLQKPKRLGLDRFIKKRQSL